MSIDLTKEAPECVEVKEKPGFRFLSDLGGRSQLHHHAALKDHHHHHPSAAAADDDDDATLLHTYTSAFVFLESKAPLSSHLLRLKGGGVYYKVLQLPKVVISSSL